MNHYKKQQVSKKSLISFTVVIIMIMSLFVFSFCNKDDTGDGFTADFSFEYIDSNHVQFHNESVGEYYSLVWDFGNQQGDTTTDKSKSYKIYYPYKGEYEVSLKVMNYSGAKQVVQKNISITATDFEISFTADVDDNDPNYVNLTNTTIGNYDSFKWLYRNKEVKNQNTLKAYLPFAGNYNIELQVTRNGNSYSLEKVVNITRDDPDYFDNLTLAWSDEFDGASINTDNWKFETGATGWGNNELQNYTNGDNAEITDGKLVITAKKVDDNTAVGSYTSSRIISENKQEFLYGRIEIRAKLPSGRGIWPAIWMLGSNFRTDGWPACGEMDIMEYVGYEPNIIWSTVHTPAGYGANGDGSSKTLTTCEEEFHVYGLLWTEKKLVFYTDSPDNVTHTYAPAVKTNDNWPFNKSQFLILNVAVGGDWGGAQGIDNSIFPQTMEIDYIRVYQEE